MAYLANCFKRFDPSDMDMVIRLPQAQKQKQPDVCEDVASPPMKRARQEPDEAADADLVQLASFPAYRLVVFSTDYFKAQVRRGSISIC
jgi:hypothetical protein